MLANLADELGRVETATLEFKREAKDRDALRRAICALANDLVNAGGGDLIVGVDSQGAGYGADVSDGALLSLAQIRDEGKILERPSTTVEAASWDGRPVVRIHVNASSAPPVRLDGVAWVRPGPLTKRASANDERVLSERRVAAALPFDAQTALGANEADLDAELLSSTYLPAAVAPEVLEENGRPLDQQFRSLRLIDTAGTPTHLGLLLGAFDPTVFIPGAYLQFVRYEGVDPSTPIRDEDEIRDNLITAARTLTSLLQANLERRVLDRDALRDASVPDYPLAALREAIMNAISHRAYEATNAPVRILWFSDRVEISNPGGPFGVVTQENFDRVNDYRNPSLAAALKNLGYVNRFGHGIARMRALMETNGNPPPEFEVQDQSWTVVLRSAGSKAGAE